MTHEHRTVKPGRKAGTVLTDSGEELTPPSNWALLPPGDGPLTRQVKAKGPTWLVQVKVGRRLMSRGIWADSDHIREARDELSAKRAAPDYDLKRAKELARKEKKHIGYVQEFYQAVLDVLAFDPRYRDLAARLARAVAMHATPVGSGTVARTERIPLTDRARAALVAWLRHQATAYDRMRIERIKGRRREVRRELAAQSMAMLQPYRRGETVDSSTCPLQLALTNAGSAEETGNDETLQRMHEATADQAKGSNATCCPSSG